MTEEATVVEDLAELDAAPTGADLNRRDYVLLFALGLLVPAILLVWGWL